MATICHMPSLSSLAHQILWQNSELFTLFKTFSPSPPFPLLNWKWSPGRNLWWVLWNRCFLPNRQRQTVFTIKSIPKCFICCRLALIFYLYSFSVLFLTVDGLSAISFCFALLIPYFIHFLAVLCLNQTFCCVRTQTLFLRIIFFIFPVILYLP